MIRLSVVIPVYGVEKWIERCLRSIVDDHACAVYCELIVVDDGSPDKSIEIVQRVCAGHDNVHIIRQANQGLGAARNTGAQAASGDYLWFIDSDDWLPPNALSRVLAAIGAIKDLDVLNIDYVMSNGRHSKVKNNAQPGHVYSGVEYLALSLVQNPVQYYVYSTKFYRGQRLEFEREVYHEDALFTPLALFRAQHVARLAEDCYVYNLREGSIMTSGNYLKHALDMVHVVRVLEQFRKKEPMNRHGSRVLATYSALAVGGVYYYWKRLDAHGRGQVAVELRLIELLQPVLRARRFKYLYALIVMQMPQIRRAAAAA